MNNNSEKIIAIAALIKGFATSQFRINQIDPSLAYIIMKSVCEHYAEKYIDESVLSRVSFVDDEKRERRITETKTGTIEDLKKDMENMGFKPSKTEETETAGNTGS